MHTASPSLTDKVAIITGGSRGIGRAIALQFAQRGAKIVLAALHDETLDATLKELRAISPDAEGCGGDISNPALAEEICRCALEQFGRVDILVNCAGMISRTPMEDLSHEEWHRVINVNLHGTFYISQAVLPHLCEQGSGKIINITSQMAWLPHPSASPSYEVSKAGMTALTRHMAHHYAKHNIQINSIAPGSIDTDLPKSMSDQQRRRLKDAIPLLRLGEPEEVAHLALFLASDQSDYITGASININGGSLMD